MNETIPGERAGEIPSAGRQEPRWEELLNRARDIAKSILAPRANEVDQGSEPPSDNVRALAEAGLLGLSTPEEFGGLGAPGAVLREYSETIAGACGVTTFVQGQHLSACSLIAGADNDELKRRALPDYAKGARLCGVAFSHLRRPGPPTMRVREENGCFVFDGVAPWLTGWGVMQDVVLGGTFENGQLLYAVATLETSEAMWPSEPMPLCAMNASGTVELFCKGFRVPVENAMKTITQEQMSVNDLGAILGVTPQIFGASSASIRLVSELAQRRDSSLLHEVAETLQEAP